MSHRKQQRADWGSIQVIDKGKRYRLRYWSAVDGVYKRYSETGARGTRKQAYDHLAELRIERTQDAPYPTVGECWERWIVPTFNKKIENGKMSAHSQRTYISAWTAHIRQQWKDVSVDNIKPLDVQNWLDGFSKWSALVSLQLIKQIIDVAVKYEIIETNKLNVKFEMPIKQKD